MAKRKKRKSKNALPSGNYRVQAYDYTDKKGKRHYKSFTAGTKKEAQIMALEWKNSKDEKETIGLTVHEAVERYIDIKRNVLSPATVRGYDTILRTRIGGIANKPISLIKNADLQLWVSDLARELSPKTVRNIYGLVAASLDMFAPERIFKVTLPAKKKPDLYCPSDSDIKRLLEHIKGTELEIAVMLAAFATMRRGEICALTSADIHKNKISINKSKVMGDDHEWYIKQPKTYSSYREVEVPKFVIDRIKDIDGNIIQSNPNQISNKFDWAVNRAGLPHFRFHDLRHYSASILHAIGVPDQYIMQRGGWASDNIMKTVYRNAIGDETINQTKVINDHFNKFAV